MAASGVLRKGPPDAVRINFLTSLMLPGAQALMDGVVFAIDGKEFDSGPARRGHYDFAGCDQNFLIRKRYLLAGLYGGVSCLEADHADGCGNQDGGRGMRGHRQHAFGAMLNLRQFREASGAQALDKPCGCFGRGDRNEFRAVARNLLGQFLDVVACGQGHDAETAGHGFHDGQRLPPDRPGGTKNGNLLQDSALNFPANSLPPEADRQDSHSSEMASVCLEINPLEIVPDGRCGQDQGVDAIEHPSVPRQDCAGILHAGAAFPGGFK